MKERAYGEVLGIGHPSTQSARSALGIALTVLLRLFAPYCPFVTEEVWRWWHDGSIHRANWPVVEHELEDADGQVLVTVSEALTAIRGAKSQAKTSMKAPVAAMTVAGPAETLDRLRLAESDLRAVSHLTGDITWVPSADPLTITVHLADPAAA